MSQMYLPLAEGCRLAQEISVEIAHKKQTSRIQFRLDSSKKKTRILLLFGSYTGNGTLNRIWLLFI